MASRLWTLRARGVRHAGRRCLPAVQTLDFSEIPLLKDNVAMKNLALQASRGGRSSVSGIRATVFGATGFLGRYVVNKLGQIGSQVVIPYRWDFRDYMHMKLMGDLGQIIPVPYQIRDPESVGRVIQDSNIVVNLMGTDYDTWNYTLHDVHVNAVEMICQKAVENGVDRFVHVSAAGASADAECRWLRTKWHGEQIVKKYYPEATIIRPSTIYGIEDRFTQQIAQFYSNAPNSYMNMFARHLFRPFMWNGYQRVQPVAVEDVALAIMRCIQDPVGTASQTYSLFGDMTATRKQFHERAAEICDAKESIPRGPQNRDPFWFLPLFSLMEPLERRIPLLLGGRPNHECTQKTTADLLRRSLVDFVEDMPSEKSNLGLRDLGITPLEYLQEEGRLMLRHHAWRPITKDEYWNKFSGTNWTYLEYTGEHESPKESMHCDEPANSYWWEEDWEKESVPGKLVGVKSDVSNTIGFLALGGLLSPLAMLFMLAGQ